MGIEKGTVGRYDMLEWLQSAAAERPLRALAVVAAIRSAHEKVCEDAGLRDALMKRRVALHISSFSQRRDCRGFRARDEVRTISGDCWTLLLQPDHLFWSALERGVRNEVRDLQLSECS